MDIALGGYQDDNPDDPIWMLGPAVDLPTMGGPLRQERLEDLQLFAFLAAVAATGGAHPLRVGSPTSDPPDRVITTPQGQWGLELTALTLEHVRGDLAPIRAAGRKLQARLDASGEHEHLRGQMIMVSPALPSSPNQSPPDIDAAIEALKEDRGTINDGTIDFSAGMPEQLPKLGFYGNVGGLFMHVNGAPGIPGRIVVAASAGATISRSQALAALAARVEAKDDPRNDALLITCGLPDKLGYTCAVDGWIYHHLAEVFTTDGASLPTPKHLTTVAIHNWSTGEWRELYRADGASALWGL